MKSEVREILTDFLAWKNDLAVVEEKMVALEKSRETIRASIDLISGRLWNHLDESTCPFGLQVGDQHVVVTHDEHQDRFDVHHVSYELLTEIKES